MTPGMPNRGYFAQISPFLCHFYFSISKFVSYTFPEEKMFMTDIFQCIIDFNW